MSDSLFGGKNCVVDFVVEDQFSPDLLEGIKQVLPVFAGIIECPQCFSGVDCFFTFKSREANKPLFRGIAAGTVTRLDKNVWLTEGANGSGINIGKMVPGETIRLEHQPAAALVLPIDTMNDLSALAQTLAEVSLSEQWASKSGSFTTIQLLRTNDPLIS